MNWHDSSPTDQKKFDPALMFEAGMRLHHIANTAYPIGHTTTMRPYRVKRNQVQGFAPAAWQDADSLGLYVHIPFCEARCGFCEYTVVDPTTNAQEEQGYVDLLMKEFALYAAQIGKRRLIGFDIGGGTPAYASTENIRRVVEAAKQHFTLDEATISIETTPKIAARTPEKIQAFKAMGIDRISMGVQTINPRLLAQYGRSHTALDFNRQATIRIREAGFKKFNIDLMYGFANQRLENLEATVKHVTALAPEYVTLYRMRYKGTRVASQADRVGLDEVNAQEALAKNMLIVAGYAGADGKNTFSRIPDDVGTSDYLSERVINGTPYLGLGLGAQSLSPTTLAYNNGAADKRIRLYRRKIEAGELPIQDLYHLSREAAMAKMLSVAFYFGEINLESFARKFGIRLEEAFTDEVAFLIDQGLMAYTESEYVLPTTLGTQVLRLTEAGVKQKNGVIAQFYNGEVKAHLLEQAEVAAERTATLPATHVMHAQAAD